MAMKSVSVLSTFFADCEAPIVLALVIMGYVIRHLCIRGRRGAAGRGLPFRKDFKKDEFPACSRNVVSGLLQLPVELRSEVTQLLSVQDLAAVSGASCNTFQGIWENREVWLGLIQARKLVISGVLELRDSSIIREAFRKAVFNVDSAALKELALRDGQGLLREVSHILRGLMPRDEPLHVEMIYQLIMQVLRAYDPASARAREIAETMLCTVRTRCDLLAEPQIANIECAYDDTVQIHDLMEKAAQYHLDRMFEDVGRSPDVCGILPAVDDEVH